MPTTRQIAELAGVAPSTVSLALRGDPRVRAETRERIMQLAGLYQHRPAQSAPSLASSSARLIGCIVPSIAWLSLVSIIQGIVETAFEESYQLIILESQNDVQRILQAIHVLVEHRVKGILISVNGDGAIPEAGLLELRSQGIASMLIQSSIENHTLDEVMLDEAQLGEIAAQCLLDYGHREIGFIGAIRRGRASIRASSFKQALRRHGLSTTHFIDLYQDRYVDFNTALALTDLLRAPNPPTAIFTGNDEIAVKLMMEALTMGMRIPKDLSVIGAGDFYPHRILVPQLTTINERWELTGRSAMHLLLQRLQQPEKASAPPQTLRIAPVLVKRASCGAPRQARSR